MAKDHVIRGDARQMQAVPDEAVQLIVTSPPYNVSIDYADHSDDLSLDEYIDFLNAVWRECYRVLVPGGRLCINVANTDRKPYLSVVSVIDEQLRAGEQKWLHRGHIIWDKGACLSGNTKIYVRDHQDGHVSCRRLESVYAGGRWQQMDVEGVDTDGAPCWLPLHGLWKTEGTRGLCLTCTGGFAVTATGEHRFVRPDGSLVQARDLHVGDHIRRSKHMPDFPGHVPSALGGQDLAWALGLYLAEGTMSASSEKGVRTVRYSLHTREAGWVDRLIKAWEPFGARISTVTHDNKLNVNVTGYLVHAIISEFMSGRTSHDKLPLSSVLGAPRPWRQAFLQGWLDGDGYFEEKANRWEGNITGANLRFMPTMHALARSLDYRMQHGAGWTTAESGGKRHMVVRWKLYVQESQHHNAVSWDEAEIKEICEDTASFYDLSLEHEPHLFVLANGIISHNSTGISTAWGSFGRASNPTLRDVHEYITIWSKDDLRLDGGGPTGINNIDFVNWTRSVWRREDLLAELERKIAEKLADARRRDKDDAWIAQSIARAVWGQATEPGANVWQMTTESSVEHPTPYPVELPRRLIQLYTSPGDVVLDPFMGSGTTAVAAVLTGRRYAGYELSSEYCALAQKRIEAACPLSSPVQSPTTI